MTESPEKAMASEADHLTVSLTTIHARLPTLHATLESLASQDYPNLTVRLYLSREPYLLDKGVDALPAACLAVIERHRPRIEIRYVENIGPYRKLIPFIAENIGRNALVITADDDTLYPPDWASTLHRNYRRRRCIVAYRGHQMRHRNGAWTQYRSWMRQSPDVDQHLLHLPTGKDGVLYNTLFFLPDVLDMKSAARYAPTVDDLWFKWHSAWSGVPVAILHQDYRESSLPEVTKEHSLYKTFNESGANDQAVAALEALFCDRYGQTLVEKFI